MGLEELPSKSADAASDGDEKKTENHDEDRGKKILVPASGGAFDRVKGEEHPHHGDDDDGADHHGAHGNVAIDAAGRGGLAGAFGANVFESSAQGGNDCGHGAKKRDQTGGGDGACAHRTNVAAPEIVWRHQRNRNGGGIDRSVAGELAVELDGGHDHQPGDDAAGEKNS